MSPVDSVMVRARTRNILHAYIGSPLQVFALWQPWATLFVAPDPLNNDEPPKTHETRHWYPRAPMKVPFYVAVHAAKKFDTITKDALGRGQFHDALKRCGFYPGDPRPLEARGMAVPGGLRPLQLGAVIGLATIDLVVSAQPLSMQAQLAGVQSLDLDSLSPDDRAFGYFEPNLLETDPKRGVRYAWRASDTILLPKPIPHHGRQEPLYPVDGDLRWAINEQLIAMEAAL